MISEENKFNILNLFKVRNKSIKNYWIILRLLLLTILITSFFGVTVLGMDQVTDIFIDLEQESILSAKNCILFISTLIWSFSLFSTTLMILYTVKLEINKSETNFLKTVVFKIPYFLCSAPFIFLAICFFSLRASTHFYFYLIAFIFSFYKGVIAKYDDEERFIQSKMPFWEEIKEVYKERKELIKYFLYLNLDTISSIINRVSFFKGIINVEKTKNIIDGKSKLNVLLFIVVTIFISIFFIICCTRPINIRITPSITPLPLIIVAFSMYTIVAMVFSILNFDKKFPAIIVTLIFVYFSASFNNNHLLRDYGIESYNEVNSRPEDEIYINDWLDTLINEHKKKYENSIKNDKVDSVLQIHKKEFGILPIYLVAAEGGGIRATYWTANVLAKLGQVNSDFNRRTICLSGVSGGSIGISIYRAYLNKLNDLAEGVSGGHRTAVALYPTEVTSKVLATTKRDFLSPLVGSFLFGDAFQRTIPFKIPYLDRARLLESAITLNYSEVSLDTKDRLNLPFLKRASTKDANRPIILFNSTLVESGQKAIFSNVELTNTIDNDVFDILKETQVDYPYITTAVTSARFPFITPPGKINVANTNGLGVLDGHLVDGGYIDNTGLQSVLMILKILDKSLRKKAKTNDGKLVCFKLNDNSEESFEIKPIIIFIKNGDKKIKQNKPIGWKYELSPFLAFYNAYDRKTIPMENTLSQLTQSVCSFATVHEIALNRNTTTNLPLSWYLSKKAQNILDEQLSNRNFKLKYEEKK